MKKDIWRYFFIFAMISLTYMWQGLAALQLALPPGVISPVWPASGLALAVLILYGRKYWPAVFLGSFVANAITNPATEAIAIPLSLGIGLGASLQAIIGEFLWQKFSVSSNLFDDHRNVIALFLAAFIGCVINSTLGTFLIYTIELIPSDFVMTSWVTWWLGDASGIVLFTPFLLCWLQPFSREELFRNLWKVAQMCIVIIFFGLISFNIAVNKYYHLSFLVIPCLLWIAFRFGAYGATFALLAFSSFAILVTTGGFGPFVRPYLTLNESLLLLQIFISVISATTLLVLAILSELKRANQELENHSSVLERRVVERTLQLQERNQTLQERGDELNRQNMLLEKTLHRLQMLQQRIITQEKLASLGSLMAGISHQMRNPLNFVINFAEIGFEAIEKAKEWLKKESADRGSQDLKEIQDVVKWVSDYLERIYKHGKKANAIVEKMIVHASGGAGSYEPTNVNELVEEFTTLAYYSAHVRDQNFKVQVTKHLDRTLEPINIIPQAVSRAMINILNNAFYSVVQKGKSSTDPTFVPLVTISTKNLGDHIAIIVRDNGLGIANEDREKLFHPFFTTKQGDGVGYGLALSRDLIEREQEGEITVDSIQGQYAEFTVLLPKEPIALSPGN